MEWKKDDNSLRHFYYAFDAIIKYWRLEFHAIVTTVVTVWS